MMSSVIRSRLLEIHWLRRRPRARIKSTGNNLVEANEGQAQDTPVMRPGFDTLDTGKKGYLTAHDVKSQQSLSKHFTKCNLNHDGHLTQDEYANCHK
jgi:hypothetical protein